MSTSAWHMRQPTWHDEGANESMKLPRIHAVGRLGPAELQELMGVERSLAERAMHRKLHEERMGGGEAGQKSKSFSGGLLYMCVHTLLFAPNRASVS